MNDLTIFRVVAGEHDLRNVSGLEQNRDVSGYLMHPDYNTNTNENDIALIYVIYCLVLLQWKIIYGFCLCT